MNRHDARSAHVLQLNSPRAPKLSVVIPLYNEVDSIAQLQRQLSEALAALALLYEIIVVDDGGSDGSGERLRACHASDAHLKVVRFRRNVGETGAFAAGFDLARGDVVATPFSAGERGSSVAGVVRESVPASEVTPANVGYALSVRADEDVIMDYTVRVRDHNGKLAKPTDDNLYVNNAATVAPPIAPPMP